MRGAAVTAKIDCGRAVNVRTGPGRELLLMAGSQKHIALDTSDDSSVEVTVIRGQGWPSEKSRC